MELYAIPVHDVALARKKPSLQPLVSHSLGTEAQLLQLATWHAISKNAAMFYLNNAHHFLFI